MIEVRNEDELEEVSRTTTPRSSSSRHATARLDQLEAVLELLPDVPAGKLAIADVDVGDRDEVLKLERAGFDAVLVPAGPIGSLVGHTPPDV